MENYLKCNYCHCKQCCGCFVHIYRSGQYVCSRSGWERFPSVGVWEQVDGERACGINKRNYFKKIREQLFLMDENITSGWLARWPSRFSDNLREKVRICREVSGTDADDEAEAHIIYLAWRPGTKKTYVGITDGKRMERLETHWSGYAEEARRGKIGGRYHRDGLYKWVAIKLMHSPTQTRSNLLAAELILIDYFNATANTQGRAIHDFSKRVGRIHKTYVMNNPRVKPFRSTRHWGRGRVGPSVLAPMRAFQILCSRDTSGMVREQTKLIIVLSKRLGVSNTVKTLLRALSGRALAKMNARARWTLTPGQFYIYSANIKALTTGGSVLVTTIALHDTGPQTTQLVRRYLSSMLTRQGSTFGPLRVLRIKRTRARKLLDVLGTPLRTWHEEGARYKFFGEHLHCACALLRKRYPGLTTVDGHVVCEPVSSGFPLISPELGSWNKTGNFAPAAEEVTASITRARNRFWKVQGVLNAGNVVQDARVAKRICDRMQLSQLSGGRMFATAADISDTARRLSKHLFVGEIDKSTSSGVFFACHRVMEKITLQHTRTDYQRIRGWNGLKDSDAADEFFAMANENKERGRPLTSLRTKVKHRWPFLKIMLKQRLFDAMTDLKRTDVWSAELKGGAIPYRPITSYFRHLYRNWFTGGCARYSIPLQH
eukprot:g9158.t1